MQRGKLVLAVCCAVVTGVLAPAAGASVLAPTPPTQSSTAQDPTPNFVVVVTDDQRWDSIGRCAPTFDGSDHTAGPDSCMPQVAQKLVPNGVTFLRGEVNQSLCCPSRASILSGQYTRHHGVQNLEGSLFDDTASLATWLDDAGYRTGLFGKYLNGYGSGPLTNYIPPGWDAFHSFHAASNFDNPYTNYPWIDWQEGSSTVISRMRDADSTTEEACAAGNYYSTDLICRQALDWLGADPDDPFFLYLAPFAPHDPNTPAGRHTTAFPGLTVTPYPSTNVVPTPNTPSYLPGQPLSGSTMKRNNDGRARQIRTSLAVDDMVGQVWDRLADDGRLATTVWVFISDNGFAAGEHRLTGKQCPYLECHRVPFVVVCPPTVCPGAVNGTRDAVNYALNIDIAPTIVELAGAAATLRMDGRSLVPLLSDPAAPWRAEWGLFDLTPTFDGMVARASTGDWFKYLVKRDTGEIQLFNLTADPWELTNLWNDAAHTSIEADMAARLADFLTNPTLTITEQPPASGTGTSATVGFSSSDIVTFECRLDAAPTFSECGTGTSGSITYTGLTAATHTVTVQAVDAFGNVSPVSTVVFALTGVPGDDSTPPTAPSGLVATSVTQTTVGLAWSASTDDVGVDHYVVVRDGVDLATSPVTSYTDATVAASTSYQYEVQALDAAGNRSAGSGTITVTTPASSTDTTPPTVSIDAPTAGATVSGTVTVSATADDDVAVDSVEVRVDGVAVGTATTAPYSVPWDTTAVADGSHVLTAVATDTSGNTATSTEVTVTVGNVVPPAQFTASPNPATTSQVVTFTDTHPGTHRRTITFGDGATARSKSQTFTHTYAAPGTYTATLQTIDLTTGLKTTLSVTVTVTAPGAAAPR